MAKKKRQLRIFSLASFFNDLGSDMIYPIWPLFVTSVLGADMAILGLLDGLGNALSYLSRGASGYLSDRIRKRKIFIWTGYLFGSLSRLGYALSKVWWWLIPFKILDRMGKIRGAPRDAIIADIATRKTRGRYFGILRLFDNIGGIVGIILALIFIQFLEIRTILYIAATPSIVSVLIIIFFIKERVKGLIDSKKLEVKLINKNFKFLLASVTFLSLASFSYSFLLIFAKEIGYSYKLLPLLYLIFTIFAAIASYIAGRLSDRFGRKKLIVTATIIYIAMLFGFIYAGHLLLFPLLFAVYGIFKGSIDTVQTTFASELCPREKRATGIGTFQMFNGLFALPSSFLAGILWMTVDKAFPLMIAALFAVVSIPFLLFIKKKKI